MGTDDFIDTLQHRSMILLEAKIITLVDVLTRVSIIA